MISPARLVVSRKAAGYLKQVDFAAKLGIPQSRLSAYETGDRPLPMILHIPWADAVGRSLDYMHGRLDVFRQVSSSRPTTRLIEGEPGLDAGAKIVDADGRVEVVKFRAITIGAPAILVTTPEGTAAW